MFVTHHYKEQKGAWRGWKLLCSLWGWQREELLLLTLPPFPQGNKGAKGERGERGDRGLRGDPVSIAEAAS